LLKDTNRLAEAEPLMRRTLVIFLDSDGNVLGANTLAGAAGNDTFIFFSDHANGATVVDFDGLGAAHGDGLIFSGFGSAAQGATFTSLGGNTWQIHSGLDAHNETITLSNGASIHATDFLFV